MSKIRLFKGKLENKRVEEAISKKGLGLATAGLVMVSGIMLSEKPQEVHAENLEFNRVYNGGAFNISGVPEEESKLQVDEHKKTEESVVERETVYSNRPRFLPDEVVKQIKEEKSAEPSVEATQEYFDLVEFRLKQVIGSKYTYNPKLAIGEYRKAIHFQINENNGLQESETSVIAKLLNYHGSKEFDIRVTKTDSTPKNHITVVVGFNPDLTVKDENGYATRLNLNVYTQEDLNNLTNRYKNVLNIIGYNAVDNKDKHILIGELEFRMNYNNGRIQYEYNKIMDLIDNYIKDNNPKADINKEFSLKVTVSDKEKHVKVSIFSNIPKIAVNKETESSSILKAEIEVKDPVAEIKEPVTEVITPTAEFNKESVTKEDSKEDVVNREKENVTADETKPLEFNRTGIADSLVIVPDELTPEQQELKKFVDSVNSKILNFVNEERSKNGKTKLRVDENSTRYALEKSTNMLDDDSLTLDNSVSTTVKDYMLGDNNTVSQVEEYVTKVSKSSIDDTVQDIINGLKKDSNYTNHMLSDEFELTGVGICLSGNTIYATQIFIK